MNISNWQSITVQANGQRIHLTIAGSAGPVVLLCHGFPESWHSWRHQLAALSAAGYRAVAMDMRGYGRSSKPSGPHNYRISELVADCVGVVEAIGESSAVIIGHDIGAPVAWTAAWTRPDIFHAVVGLSLPFGGRGLACLPGNPHGDIRPSIVEREIAGPGMLFYQEYFCLPDNRALLDAETDLRSWLASVFYSLSADRPLPPELMDVDLTRLPEEMLKQFVRATMCVPQPGQFGDMLVKPDALPAWLSKDDLDFCTAELEHTGLSAPLNYYRNADLDWEDLAQYEGRSIDIPALFIGGDRDVATIWSQQSIAHASERCTDLRGTLIVKDCGHWIQQEKPEIVNEALLTFLQGL